MTISPFLSNTRTSHLMFRIAISTILILSIISCQSYHSLEGRAKPVYFTADPEISSDTLQPVLAVSYPIIKGLKGGIVESTEIRPGEFNKAIIKEPTLFYFEYNTFLAYPNERIIIKGSLEDPIFVTARGNKQRDNELKFFQAFNKLHRYPTVPRDIINPSLDTILKLEKEQQHKILEADLLTRRLFDSLAQAYDVSAKFKKLAHDYVDNRNDGSLLWIYRIYKDTLKAHHLYFEKLRGLIPSFNAIDNDSAFNYNVRTDLNDLVRELFPENYMWSMNDEEGFRRCFDSVAKNFTGISRDYLLSRIMYRAHSLGLPVKRYRAQYYRYNSNDTYRRIVRKARRERQQSNNDNRGLPNRLLTAGDNKEIRLESVLEEHKGKLVVIDLWASWCLPCLKEIPHFNQLINRYTEDQVVFISISLDKYTASWREAIAKHSLQTVHNYLLLNAMRATFTRQYKINEIPRYMLIGKDGRMVNDNAPGPSDESLLASIDRLLLGE